MFTTRDRCPACKRDALSTLCDIDFAQIELARFLNEFYQSRIEPQFLDGHHYTLCECQYCKLVFQQHILDDTGMSLLYEQWISAAASMRKRQHGKKKQFRKYAAECETIARMIDKPPHDIRVVEFGMGWGYWSRMAVAFNYQVTGLELSSERIAHAQSMGVQVATDFKQIPESGVDFIYANQVLEHIANPREILAQLKALLAPDGILLIRVPDARGIAHRLRRNGWAPSMSAVHPLEHINAFTRTCLLTVASELELKEVRAPIRLSAHTPAQLWRSAMREFNDRFRLPHIYFRKT